MPRRYTIGEVGAIVIDGANDLADEVAEAGRKAYCSIVQSNPFSAIYNNPLTLNVSKRALAAICREEPPAPPPPPFVGGQCEFVRYRVTVDYKLNSDRDLQATTVVWGSIKGVASEQFQTGWRLCVNGGSSTDPGVARCSSVSFQNTVNNPFSEERISSVERVDGGVDDCGNPPEGFYDFEPPPSDSQISGTVSVVNNSGDTNTYNTTINRDGDSYVRFPSVVNVNGISVGIDATGISVGEVNINRRSGGGGGNPNDDGGSVTQDSEGETGVDGGSEEAEELPEEEVEDSQEETVDKLLAIKVTVSSIPSNAKTVSGRGAPNLIYAGWVEFKVNGFYFPREFIDFNKQYYPAPEGASGYAITFKRGYSGSVVKVVKPSSAN